MKWALREFPSLPLKGVSITAGGTLAVFDSDLGISGLGPSASGVPVTATTWLSSAVTTRPQGLHFGTFHAPIIGLGVSVTASRASGLSGLRPSASGVPVTATTRISPAGSPEAAARPQGLHFGSFRAPIIGPQGCPHPRWRRCVLCSQWQLPRSPPSRTH